VLLRLLKEREEKVKVRKLKVMSPKRVREMIRNFLRKNSISLKRRSKKVQPEMLSNKVINLKMEKIKSMMHLKLEFIHQLKFLTQILHKR